MSDPINDHRPLSSSLPRAHLVSIGCIIAMNLLDGIVLIAGLRAMGVSLVWNASTIIGASMVVSVLKERTHR